MKQKTVWPKIFRASEANFTRHDLPVAQMMIHAGHWVVLDAPNNTVYSVVDLADIRQYHDECVDHVKAVLQSIKNAIGWGGVTAAGGTH